MTTLALLGGAAIAAAAFAACGNEPAPAAPPQPAESASASAAPAPEPEPAPTASASASAAASAAPAAPKPESSGRPAVLKSDASEITDTFGSTPASKLELGEKEIATLRLPEGALRTGTLITFKIVKSGAKTTGGLVGKVYEIKAVVPPSSTGEQMESQGPPFVLEMPIGKKSGVNLAVGVEDDKGRVKWNIVAAKRIDDSRNVAVFELPTLPSGFVHVTTKPATGGK